VLRHENEPGLAGALRVAIRHGRSAAQDFARVGREPPCGDRYERGFPRAVLAEEGVDLAGKNDEICFEKSLGFAEALRDTAKFERGKRR
jgi:hypothetical protein